MPTGIYKRKPETLKMLTNRNYIGIEISPEYIEIINKRLN